MKTVCIFVDSAAPTKSWDTSIGEPLDRKRLFPSSFASLASFLFTWDICLSTRTSTKSKWQKQKLTVPWNFLMQMTIASLRTSNCSVNTPQTAFISMAMLSFPTDNYTHVYCLRHRTKLVTWGRPLCKNRTVYNEDTFAQTPNAEVTRRTTQAVYI